MKITYIKYLRTTDKETAISLSVIPLMFRFTSLRKISKTNLVLPLGQASETTIWGSVVQISSGRAISTPWSQTLRDWGYMRSQPVQSLGPCPPRKNSRMASYKMIPLAPD
jgi:hypothetical protein